MSWLFGQTWIWVLIAIILGLVIGFLVAWLLRKKEVGVTEERVAAPAAATDVASEAPELEEAEPTQTTATSSADAEVAGSNGPALSMIGTQDADLDTATDTPAVGMPAQPSGPVDAGSAPSSAASEADTGRIPAQTATAVAVASDSNDRTKVEESP